MKKPLLSIIVPVYKVEEYIKSCLDSILSQTFRDYEVILVDDGSPDNSGTICDEYALRDGRFRVIHKLNGGLSAARNDALDMAQGRYVTFIDSDDEYGSPTTIEENMAILEADGAIDLLQYPYVYVDGAREVLHLVPEKVLSRQGFLDSMLNEEVPGYTWIKIYKADIFKRKRFSCDIKVAEDLDFLIEVLDGIDKVFLSERGQYRYYKRDGSLVVNKTVSKEMDVAGVYQRLLKTSVQYSGTDALARANFFFVALGHLLRTVAKFGDGCSEGLNGLMPFVPDSSILFSGLKGRNRLKLLQIKAVGLKRYAALNVFFKRRKLKNIR